MNQPSIAIKIAAALSLAAATVPCAVLAATAARHAPAPAAPATPDAAVAGKKLAAAIRAEIGDPASAHMSAEDLEAMIVFVISQGKYSNAAIADALARLSVKAPATMIAAIGNVRTAMVERKLDGTGAVHSANGINMGTSGAAANVTFSYPAVNTGGGSVNYSS